jgi:hypothetical protein
VSIGSGLSQRSWDWTAGCSRCVGRRIACELLLLYASCERVALGLWHAVRSGAAEECGNRSCGKLPKFGPSFRLCHCCHSIPPTRRVSQGASASSLPSPLPASLGRPASGVAKLMVLTLFEASDEDVYVAVAQQVAELLNPEGQVILAAGPRLTCASGLGSRLAPQATGCSGAAGSDRGEQRVWGHPAAMLARDRCCTVAQPSVAQRACRARWQAQRSHARLMQARTALADTPATVFLNECVSLLQVTPTTASSKCLSGLLLPGQHSQPGPALLFTGAAVRALCRADGWPGQERVRRARRQG